MDPAAVWDALDPSEPPELRWIRAVQGGGEVVLLLGAFDPPTLAHLSLVHAAVRRTGAAGAFCLTKAILARPAGECLSPPRRLELLARIADEEGLGLAVANRGTYLDVGDAARRLGYEPQFVIGSDKLPKLEDPTFYPDGEAGVERTFARYRFLVVPRGARVERTDVVLLSPEDVFEEPRFGRLSATEVRERLKAGDAVDGCVPPIVARELARYTQGQIELR